MNLTDIILILLIGAAVVYAVITCIKRGKKGGCGCGCEGCTGCGKKRREDNNSSNTAK